MTEPQDTMIKRLAMRSMRRGIKEMDLILSDFAQRRLAHMSQADLELYDKLLSEADLEIYGWILGQAEAPAHYAPLMDQIIAGADGLVAKSSTPNA